MGFIKKMNPVFLKANEMIKSGTHFKTVSSDYLIGC